VGRQHPEQEGATGQAPTGVVADLEHTFGVESERLEWEGHNGQRSASRKIGEAGNLHNASRG
jgi:hypothetical protein